MTGWGDAAFDAYLPADMVLGHADIAVVVTDRLSNLIYLNDFAARLFRIPGDAARLAGCPVESLGLFADGEVRRTGDLTGQVLRGPFNFMDTSNNYGGGSAEQRIGHVLASSGGLPPGFVLATKADADPDTGDFSGERVKRSLKIHSRSH